MNYAAAVRFPIQSSSVCTEADVSWVGAQPITQKQHHTAPISSMTVQSV